MLISLEDSDVTVDSILSLNCIDQLTCTLVFKVYFLLGTISGISPCDQQKHTGCQMTAFLKQQCQTSEADTADKRLREVECMVSYG